MTTTIIELILQPDDSHSAAANHLRALGYSADPLQIRWTSATIIRMDEATLNQYLQNLRRELVDLGANPEKVSISQQG